LKTKELRPQAGTVTRLRGTDKEKETGRNPPGTLAQHRPPGRILAKKKEGQRGMVEMAGGAWRQNHQAPSGELQNTRKFVPKNVISGFMCPHFVTEQGTGGRKQNKE